MHQFPAPESQLHQNHWEFNYVHTLVLNCGCVGKKKKKILVDFRLGVCMYLCS